MKADLMPIFEQLQSERNIDKDVLIDAIRSAIESASKKSFNNYGNVDITFDEENWDIRVFQVLEIVETVEDQKTEISLHDACVIDSSAQVGGAVRTEISPGNFGRIEPSLSRATRPRPALSIDTSSASRIWLSRSTMMRSGMRLKSKRWQRDRMVTGIFCGSVVAKMNFTCGGGSSSVLSSALNASVVSMWTSSMM